MENVLDLKSIEEFRIWLSENHKKQKFCFLKLKRGQPKIDGQLYYLDAVEIALCHGWIDTTLTLIDGKMLQKFTPRTKNSLWSELNKERVRRLEKLGLMTQAGRDVLPNMEIKHVIIPHEIKQELKKENALENFLNFPELYQRIRIYNLIFTKNKLKNQYNKSLSNFIMHTKNNEMFGQWNDYGRLVDY